MPRFLIKAKYTTEGAKSAQMHKALSRRTAVANTSAVFGDMLGISNSGMSTRQTSSRGLIISIILTLYLLNQPMLANSAPLATGTLSPISLDAYNALGNIIASNVGSVSGYIGFDPTTDTLTTFDVTAIAPRGFEFCNTTPACIPLDRPFLFAPNFNGSGTTLIELGYSAEDDILKIRYPDPTAPLVTGDIITLCSVATPCGRFNLVTPSQDTTSFVNDDYFASGTLQVSDPTLNLSGIPEPATGTLLGVALTGLGFARARSWLRRSRVERARGRAVSPSQPRREGEI